MAEQKSVQGYLHGFTPEEEDRLRRQARFLQYKVHDNLPFRRARQLIEVGSGVGAQTEILLTHFPDLRITGVDMSPPNLAAAKRHLETVPWARGRYDLVEADASRLEFQAESFDGAFLCWILEHVAKPTQVLAEVRRVLRPGAPVVVTEVQNATFFINPYSPSTLSYWLAYNDWQIELGGDPHIGAKLGNLLQGVGFRDITTKVRNFHLDNREAGERSEFIAFWTELLLSGAPSLLAAGRVTQETVNKMKEELADVAHSSEAVFFYSFVQARARAG